MLLRSEGARVYSTPEETKSTEACIGKHPTIGVHTEGIELSALYDMGSHVTLMQGKSQHFTQTQLVRTPVVFLSHRQPTALRFPTQAMRC